MKGIKHRWNRISDTSLYRCFECDMILKESSSTAQFNTICKLKDEPEDDQQLVIKELQNKVSKLQDIVKRSDMCVNIFFAIALFSALIGMVF